MSTLNVLALLNSYIMKYNTNSNNKASKSVSRALSVSLMPRALENSMQFKNIDLSQSVSEIAVVLDLNTANIC